MNRWLGGLAVILFAVAPALAEEKLTEAAAKTRSERLKVKVPSVEWKNQFLRECLAELASAVKDADLGKLEIKYDSAGGVSMNTRYTYSAKDKTVGEILDEFCAANELKYVVISKKGDKADGGILIKKK